MKNLQTGVAFISTDRLILIPFTTEIIASITHDEGALLKANKLVYGNGWPDDDAWETLPKIKKSLALVTHPSGFESWLIVKKDGLVIIGDAGFKGKPSVEGCIDIGYAIIAAERKQGFASETVQALIHWAFDKPEVNSITASCLISNPESRKILQKFEFSELNRNNEMIFWEREK
ncbi:GNAT family N-acetyltransferase [Pedobacter sp. N23S346]|uniref:GNAT family N-acetyltransferase n=1 Tax=Pedobacter sp. N23S346 TaxID=3402750 RepID=UPI003ACC77C0